MAHQVEGWRGAVVFSYIGESVFEAAAVRSRELDSLSVEKMPLPGGSGSGRVSVDTIAHYDRACGDGSVQKGVAALGSAGQAEFDQAGGSRGSAFGDTQLAAAPPSLSWQDLRRSWAVSGLIDDCEVLMERREPTAEASSGSHARRRISWEWQCRNNQDHRHDDQQLD